MQCHILGKADLQWKWQWQWLAAAAESTAAVQHVLCSTVDAVQQRSGLQQVRGGATAGGNVPGHRMSRGSKVY